MKIYEEKKQKKTDNYVSSLHPANVPVANILAKALIVVI